MPRWWHHQYSTNPAARYYVPAQWRDASDHLQLLYAHRALAASANRVFTINLRLRDDIEALARSKPSALGWLQKRVHSELQAAMGRPVDFYLCLEQDDTYLRRLHLHGELSLLPAEGARDAVRIRRALRRAAGEWPLEIKARQHQCRIAADPDEGWASYLAKDYWQAMPFTRSHLRRTRGFLRMTFDGPVLSVTRDLRSRAEALYSADRWATMRTKR